MNFFKVISFGLFGLFLYLCPTQIQSQEKSYVRLEYTKLPTNNWGGYWNEIQNNWKPLYQDMIAKGDLKAWKLFWVRFPAGTEIPYDIVSVTFHKDSVGLANAGVSKFYEAHKKTDKGSFVEMEKPLLDIINRVKLETYEVLEQARGTFELDSLARTNQNYQIDFMDSARANSEDYVKMEREVFLPMHQVAMKDGRLKSWTLCRRLSQDGNAVLQRFIILNQWSSWANWQSAGALQDFQQVDPEIDQQAFNEIFNKIGKLRQMTKSEMWSIWDEL